MISAGCGTTTFWSDRDHAPSELWCANEPSLSNRFSSRPASPCRSGSEWWYVVWRRWHECKKKQFLPDKKAEEYLTFGVALVVTSKSTVTSSWSSGEGNTLNFGVFGKNCTGSFVTLAFSVRLWNVLTMCANLFFDVSSDLLRKRISFRQTY